MIALRRLRMPGYDALNDLMNLVGPQAYSAALTSWLQANAGILPRSLALDGKSVGDGKWGMIVTLCCREDGRSVAMAPARGKKEDCEARALLANPGVNLENAVVSLDPLHNKKQTARVIIEKGGDHLIGTQKNTRRRHAATEKALATSPLLTSGPKKTTGASNHGG